MEGAHIFPWLKEENFAVILSSAEAGRPASCVTCDGSNEEEKHQSTWKRHPAKATHGSNSLVLLGVQIIYIRRRGTDQ